MPLDYANMITGRQCLRTFVFRNSWWFEKLFAGLFYCFILSTAKWFNLKVDWLFWSVGHSTL